MKRNETAWPYMFVLEGAEKRQGGNYSGPQLGFFRIWYVTGGDGTKFVRSPYVDGGWQVAKRRIGYDGRNVWYKVRRASDIMRLDAFVGVKPYVGYRQTIAEDE